jgi:leucine dehydrogenase
MAAFEDPAFDDHERVIFCRDAQTGLQAIIAIHSTALGPAAGGTRLWAYKSDDAALHDVLRLSQGMSYKNAMAGLKSMPRTRCTRNMASSSTSLMAATLLPKTLA